MNLDMLAISMIGVFFFSRIGSESQSVNTTIIDQHKQSVQPLEAEYTAHERVEYDLFPLSEYQGRITSNSSGKAPSSFRGGAPRRGYFSESPQRLERR